MLELVFFIVKLLAILAVIFAFSFAAWSDDA